MVLDETVKFASDSSELQIDDEEVDAEEAKLCAIVEEREALLVNCNEYKVSHWKIPDMRYCCFRFRGENSFALDFFFEISSKRNPQIFLNQEVFLSSFPLIALFFFTAITITTCKY